MRTNRIKCDGEGIYHLISRIVDKDFKLNDEEKDIFVKMMRKAERFSGIDVLTFAVMSNHFHILVRVPDVNPDEISNEELIDRYRALYGNTRADLLAWKWEKMGTGPALKAERDRLLARMHDISGFMKTLKSRYSISYNKRHDREGVLWSGRFKSVLFEKGSAAMLAVARYIDLNATRAGIVVDPKDYRWCGYSEACRGTKRAIEGIRMIEGFMNGDRSSSDQEVLATYGSLLHMEGQVLRKGYSKEEIAELAKRDGMIAEAIMLRCRIRHFELAVVIGSKVFVDDVRTRRQMVGMSVQVLANTKFGGFWIAKKCNHDEVIEA